MECDRAPYPRGRYPETLSGLGDFHAHAHSPLTPMRIVLLSPKIPVALHQLSGFQHQQLSLHQASCPITHISISIGITNTREDAQQVLGVFDRGLSVLTQEGSTSYTALVFSSSLQVRSLPSYPKNKIQVIPCLAFGFLALCYLVADRL